jgi:hypothetical protein
MPTLQSLFRSSACQGDDVGAVHAHVMTSTMPGADVEIGVGKQDEDGADRQLGE